MAVLEVLNGELQGQRIEIADARATIGRYPFCNIVLNNKNVSREHAQIVRKDSLYYIEDLNSLNGTSLNGHRITQKTLLNDQDVIGIYDVKIAVVLDESGVLQLSTDELAQIDSALMEGNPAVKEEVAAKLQAEPEPDAVLSINELPDIIENAEEKLRAIVEIIRSLGSSLEIDDVLPSMLEELFNIFPNSERGYILFEEGEEKALKVRATHIKSEGTMINRSLGPVSRKMGERVMSRGEAVLSTDDLEDSLELSESVLDFPIRSMMCAPLMGPMHEPLGVIYLDTKNAEHRFSSKDLEMLASVAVVAGQSVEYARKHEQTMLLDRRQRDLDMAKQVQLRFLPNQEPQIKGYSFSSYYHSAEDIGGDYYGYIPLVGNRLAISIADVAGKGVSAALLMAQLCSEMRFCLATSETPAEATEHLNLILAQPERGELFVTALQTVLDSKNHTFTLVNAGHMLPVIKRAATGTIEEPGMSISSLPLGVQHFTKFSQMELDLDPGDTVVMFTDGITEAMNPAEEPYSTGRLRKVIEEGPFDPQELLNHILKDLKAYTKGRSQSDDICLVVFGRNPE